MKTLILVDLQNDFLPGGSLAVPRGDEVIAVANRIMPSYELVVATQDWHPPGHKSFASEHAGHAVGEVIHWEGLDQGLWPDHCVQNTFGAELTVDLDRTRIDEVVQKGTDPNLDSYSGFFDNGHRQKTDLDAVLRSHVVTSIDVMGLALDVCVKYTCLDAVELGYQTRLLLEGCRAVDLKPGDGDRAVEAMREAGVEIV